MDDNKNDRFTISVILGVILVFAVVDFFARFGLMGEKSIPTERFFRHAKFEKIVFDFRTMLGKKEADGYYLGKHGRVLPMHLKRDYAREAVLKSLEEVNKLSGEYGATVILVPTADAVWAEDLPKYADSFDQRAYLDQVKGVLGDEAYVDVFQIMEQHADERLFYDTDPHWTEEAAYYVYQVWRERLNKIPYYFDAAKKVTVTRHFRGEYTALKNLSFRDESVSIYRETYRNPVSVLLDGTRCYDSFYRPEYLSGTHPYDYFLGNDFAEARIDTKRERKTSLLVIGDSFASGMIPYLAPHYDRIMFLNMERFEGDLWEKLDLYRENGRTEFLLLQNVPEYIGRFEEQ